MFSDTNGIVYSWISIPFLLIKFFLSSFGSSYPSGCILPMISPLFNILKRNHNIVLVVYYFYLACYVVDNGHGMWKTWPRCSQNNKKNIYTLIFVYYLFATLLQNSTSRRNLNKNTMNRTRLNILVLLNMAPSFHFWMFMARDYLSITGIEIWNIKSKRKIPSPLFSLFLPYFCVQNSSSVCQQVLVLVNSHTYFTAL